MSGVADLRGERDSGNLACQVFCVVRRGNPPRRLPSGYPFREILGDIAAAMRSFDRELLWAGIAAPVALTVAVLVAGSRHAGYSHVHQFISELGATGAPHRAMMNYGGLVPSGILTVLFSIAMLRTLKSHVACALGSLSVAVMGVARLGAGLFSCDPGCSLAAMSRAARLHVGFGMFAFCFGILAPLLVAFGSRVQGRGALLWLSLGVGVSSAMLFAMMLRMGPGTPYVGAVQRLILVLNYGWIVFVAIELGALNRIQRG
jgi:hypothetical membrane protein